MPLVEVPNGTVPAADESIDLPLFDVSRETPELGRQIVEAAAKWGFLWIVAAPAAGVDAAANGGDYFLDEQAIDNAFNTSKGFFKESSDAERQRCAIKHNRGYVGMHVENLDPGKHSRGDFKQAFNLAEPDHTTGQWRQPLPTEFREKDAMLRDFHARCRGLATRILRLIALGLSIPDVDWLARTHEGSPNTARFLYYPALPPDTDYNPEADIGAGAHSDYGSITLLFTRPGQPGLEILRPDDQTWAAVPVFPPNYHSSSLPPIVVNIGDLLSYWTNGLLRSTVHRVVLSAPSKAASSSTSLDENMENSMGGDRFSIAIFVQPEDKTKLTSIPSPLVEAEAAAFAKKVVGHGGGVVEAEGMGTLTAGDYLSGRLQATYGKVYEREK